MYARQQARHGSLCTVVVPVPRAGVGGGGNGCLAVLSASVANGDRVSARVSPGDAAMLGIGLLGFTLPLVAIGDQFRR
jgi:hypothetical protein